MDNRPIGIFDSGLGGLTAVKEIMKVLPGEDIVYFGDTARVPYGTRSRDTIIKYAAQDVRFMLSNNIKALVVACGTVSTVALDTVRKHCPVHLEGVLSGAVKKAVSSTKNGKIAVLGTPSTIKSGAFERMILACGDYQVMSRPCPLFVPLVENGYFTENSAIARLAVEEYLSPVRDWGADTVILGCTHYPLLSALLSAYLGDGVTLVDSGRETALSVAAFLREHDMLNEQKQGSCHYYVTDNVDNFSKLASMFLEKSIGSEVKLIDIGAK